MALPERTAHGTLGTTDITAVRVVPRHTREVLASLVLVNAGSTDVEVSAWVTVGAAGETVVAVPVVPIRLVLGALDSYHLTTPIAVEQNEEIRLQASEAGVVQYYLSAYRAGAIPSPSDRAA